MKSVKSVKNVKCDSVPEKFLVVPTGVNPTSEDPITGSPVVGTAGLWGGLQVPSCAHRSEPNQ